MVRVVVEATRGRERVWVAVRDTSIRDAIERVVARYPSGCVRLVLPIDAEKFFERGAAGLREMGEAPIRMRAEVPLPVDGKAGRR
ncbi:hypothetical protein [Rubrobacter naiadicus]|uniref:hypothetical protein n=1 Tax=Rubrobacter naiadicus TaxID=1392641 RepID=UPI0023626F07|nr:hypothetical protein [Rubrobacter naiadicus]